MTRRRGPYRVLIDAMVRFLVKEHRGYTRRFPNDLDNLAATLTLWMARLKWKAR